MVGMSPKNLRFWDSPSIPNTTGYCWRTYFNPLRPIFRYGISQALYVRRSCIQGETSGSSEFANSIRPFFETLFCTCVVLHHATTRTERSDKGIGTSCLDKQTACATNQLIELDFGHSGIDPLQTRQERAGAVRK
jgi:hypothetical protein